MTRCSRPVQRCETVVLKALKLRQQRHLSPSEMANNGSFTELLCERVTEVNLI